MENGYAKIMLGSCASAIACHVLSATVKVYLVLLALYSVLCYQVIILEKNMMEIRGAL